MFNKRILRARLTRREMLKWAVVTSGAALLPTRYKASKGLLPRALAQVPESPPTAPFVDELPIPPAPTPVRAFGNVDLACADFVGRRTQFFEITGEERFVKFHRDLPPTAIWGYRDGNPFDGKTSNFALGPTFKVRMSDRIGGGVLVRHFNDLPSTPVGSPDPLKGFGVPIETVHLHGGHHPSRSDGFPDNIAGYPPFVFGSGQFYDYCYPMLDVGYFDGPLGPTERPSTLWYHDHLLDFTGPNVYRGLAGFYLVFDEFDTGNEKAGLRLPSGPFDIPLALQDKVFDPIDGSLIFDSFEHNGFLGDKSVVNGKIQPFLRVKRRKYRFRFLDASNARFYQIFVTGAGGETYPFDQIATEGGLLSRPIRGIESFLIAPAKRVEIVFDFSPFPAGTELFVENRLQQVDGRGPAGDFQQPVLAEPGTRLLKFVVGGGVAKDPSQVPDVLRPFDPISAAEQAAATVRTFKFDRVGGAWAINGQLVDLERPDAESPRDQPEIWRVINGGGGWWHPIHIHLEFLRVLSRNGKLPPLNERDGVAKFDTVILGPDDTVDVFLKFRDYPGPYVFHCHNLEHEDMAMMARFDVV